ncbi:MAG: phosphatase PAP2 family protein [Gemmatimonadota bacterium]|nr:phosphatase PAP2 family protein [Gemmatimonadota bacterium]
MPSLKSPIGRRAQPDRRPLVLTSLCSAMGFLALTAAVERGWTKGVNREVRSWVRPRQRKGMTRAADAGTNAAAPYVHPVIALALGAAATRRTGRLAYPIPLASLGATIIDKSVRTVVHQLRPPESPKHHGLDRFAFPSGHTCATTAISLAFAAEVWATASEPQRRAVAATGVAAALGIAWTRLYLDEHWIDDIVGGWLAGISIGSIAAASR